MPDVQDIVLLHGWGTNAGIWNDLVARFAPRYRMHAWELPGYGDSPACAPYTARAIAAVLARTAPPRCQVVGWSLGALVALAWAQAAPEQVVCLALIAATPCFVQRASWPQGVEKEVLAGFSRALATDRAGTLQRFVSLQAHGDDRAREVARKLRSALAAGREPEAAALADGLEILLETDMRAELDSIRQPALVLHGDRDQLVPLAAGRHLSRGLPRARMAVLHGTAHAPFLSRPAAAAAALQELFDE